MTKKNKQIIGIIICILFASFFLLGKVGVYIILGIMLTFAIIIHLILYFSKRKYHNENIKTPKGYSWKDDAKSGLL